MKLRIIIFITFAIIIGCKKDPVSSTPPPSKQIIFPQNPFEVGLEVFSRLEPTGGNDYYTIVSIGDSSIVAGSGGGKYLFFMGKKLGQTVVAIKDSSGLQASVSVIVKSLVVRSTSITLKMGLIGHVEIESKQRNYSVISHDTTIVKPFGYDNDGTNSYLLHAIKIGKTTVDVLDSNTMLVKNIPVEVVEPPAGELHFTSNRGPFDVTNGSTDLNFVFGEAQIYNERHFVDVLHINAIKYFPDGSSQLFMISLDADSLYQGLVVDVPDSMDTRFTLIFGDSKRDTGIYWSHNAHIEITTLTASRIAGVFSGTSYFSTGAGEGTKYFLSDSLVISNGSFDVSNVDSLYSSSLFARVKNPNQKYEIFPNR